MPRQNAPRDVYAERYLAQRIAREREERGWSYEGLAARMTEAGCPLNQSAIYKIERGDPPRRITVDELVAYSRVFGIPVEHLLLDPDVEAESRVLRLLAAWRELMTERAEAIRDFDSRMDTLRAQIRDLSTRSRQASEALDRYFADVFPDSHWAADIPAIIRGEQEGKTD